jgi:uncharacterized protein (DUF927 family)
MTHDTVNNQAENLVETLLTQDSKKDSSSEKQTENGASHQNDTMRTYYLLQVHGDPEFKISTEMARKDSAKAVFLPIGWVYQGKEEAENFAKRWTQGKRIIKVVSWPTFDMRPDTIWNDKKRKAKLARQSIKQELEADRISKKRQEIILQCHQSPLHPSWLYAEDISKLEAADCSEKEKESYKYFKPLWDKTFEEEKELELKEADLERETEDVQEAENAEIEKLKKSEVIQIGNYIIKQCGLYFVKEEDQDDSVFPNNNELKEIWISSPIWPEAYLRDKDGKSHTLLIKVYDGEKDHKIPIPRRVITKWAELSEILLDLGQSVPTFPANQKHLQNFLMQARPEKLMRCVDKSGWHGDQYIFPDGEVLGKTKDSNENVQLLNEACPKGIEKKGSLQEWQDNVLKLCAKNSRLIFSIGVSLSAPCLQLVGDEGGVFNFKGVSSIGKTRCLMVAISVFGSPEFKRSWRTTSNGLEGICSLHNDCLLALDEFGQSDAKEVGEIAYMYSQGIGKQRSSRDGSPRETKTWRGMLFSTGEVGIADHIQDDKRKAKAGQLVRVLDIPAQVKNAYGCFEELHGFENGIDGERFADKIKEVCSEYYGTAGRGFIKAMIEWGVERSRKHLKFSRDDFAANVAARYDGQVKRVANRFGLIYAALSLGIELGILSGNLTKEMCEDAVKQCFKDWLNERGTTGSFESHSIINQVVGLLNENSDSKFMPKNEKFDDKRIRTTLWGYKDGPIFYVLPKAFKEDLCKGFDEQSAKNTLKDRGLLIPDNDGKFSQSLRIAAHSVAKARFYVINMDNHKEDEGCLTC